jgi:hypothetical protein
MLDYSYNDEDSARLYEAHSVFQALLDSNTDDLVQLEDLLAYTLHSPTAALRRSAIELLTIRWGLQRYRTAAGLMAENDPDAEVREMARQGFVLLSGK